MIGPLTGTALADALAGLTAGMAGQSLSDAWDSNITGTYDTYSPDELHPGVSVGIGTHTASTPAITGDTNDTIADNQETDPVDAWHDYVENEPSLVSPITGGAVMGSDSNAFNYALLQDTNNNVKAVAPVSVPVDQAYVAISKALGVAMNVREISPALGDKMVNALVNAGCVYDKAKGLVSAWWDGVKMLFPKSAVDAIAEVFEEEGIPISGQGDEGSATSPLVPGSIPIGFPSCTYEDATYISTLEVLSYDGEATARKPDTFIVARKTAGHAIEYRRQRERKSDGAISYTGQADRNTNYQYTYNGLTAYYVPFLWGGESALTSVTPAIYRGTDDNDKIAWTILYGEISGPGEYPEGTARADSESYTPETIPSAGGIATSPDDTIPVVPINLPEDPENTIGDTTDPTTGTTTPDQEEDLPAPPLPLPIPDTKPSNPDVPLVNPSIVDLTRINELVEELANTLDPQPPQSSGIIPVPPLPGILDPITGQTTFPSIIPQSGPGFIHVYNPTPAEFVAFGTWLWVTYADATIDKILNNPFDGVIGAHELYATPNRDGSDNIRSAFLTCPTTAALVTNRYSEIDCGTVVVPEFYGNYLDYSPYSQAYIYLPFIGINEVSIDDIVGHAVNIRYRIDSYSGSCIAMIFVAKDGYQNLCYQFAGSCSVEVPMAGGSQAAIKAGMMQAEAYARAAMIQAGANAVGGIGSALMGNIGGVLSSLSGIASNYAQAQAGVEAARVANKSSVQHSGQFGASHGAMGEKVPFIIIRNPIQVKVVNYNEDYGYPAHKRVIVGGCRGYLRVREVNVISAHATDEEKMAIEMALKGGVYVS